MAEVIPTLPHDLHFQIIRDQSEFIENSLHAIEEHLIFGGLLAAIVVFIFLWNFRSTIIAAIAIPTSIIAAFAFLAAFGYSLNQMTILALPLMVGIVIDDALVVLENIYRFVEEKGMSPFQAAIEGTREIGLAVMATTLSLLAVVLPVGFMAGIVGRFFSLLGLQASFSMAVSLLLSFTLTPMLSARLIKRREAAEAIAEEAPSDKPSGLAVEPNPVAAHKDSKESGFYRHIDRTYAWLLRWSLGHRWMIVGLCGVVILSIVPLFMLVGKNFLPVDDQSQFEISVRTTEGSTLAATTTVAEHIARDLHQLPGVSDTLTTIGGGQQQVVNTASIYIKLTDIKQ